jgi:Arc/MetJ family transcription regulator
MIFKGVGTGRPYPEHQLDTPADWAPLAPRMILLEELITTRSALDLRALLAEDSTFYGDIFCHVVLWRGEYYLEDGLHRALRAALQGRPAVHGRVLDLD